MNDGLLQVARLWQKTSAAGRVYYVGRWGSCRVLVLENTKRADESEPSHYLCLAEAPDRPQQDAAVPDGYRTLQQPASRPAGPQRAPRRARLPHADDTPFFDDADALADIGRR